MKRKTEEINLDTIAIGDLVTSRWSTTGAVWRITGMSDIGKPYARSAHRRLFELEAVASNRTSSDRSSWDLVRVIDA